MEEQDPLVRAWLGTAMRWRVRSAAGSAPDEAAAGAWALLIDLPADAAGSEVSIGEARLPVNWLAAAPAEGGAPLSELRHDAAALKPWLEALSADPLERWRASLLLERVGVEVEPDVDPLAPAARRHPAMESLARQEEDRWRAALYRLASIDMRLGAEIASALTDVVDFGGSRIAPAWAVSDAVLIRLRSDLLDPRLQDEHLVHRARSWLSDRPGLTTWMIDDAGAADPRGVPIVSIGVAERRGRAEMAGMRLPGLGMREEGRRTPLRPHGRIVMVRAIDAGPGPVEIEIVAGDRRSRELALCNTVEVTPPGLVIGPLLHDWRLVDWDAGVPSPSMGDGATAALLQRGVRRDAWELYIECRTPTASVEGAPSDADDHVRIWLGPTIEPVAVLRINRAGELRDGLRPGDEQVRLAVQRGDDRWSVVVPIPPEAIGADLTLRLGMQRVDGRGERSTWPRALLPWRDEPGRIALDLSAWREVGAGE